MVVDKFGRSPKNRIGNNSRSMNNNKVNKSGDIMSGNLDMSGNRIVNIPHSIGSGGVFVFISAVQPNVVISSSIWSGPSKKLG